MGKTKNNSTNENGQPWYKDGLRFKCTGCGDCCTGSEGYVWVNQAEIDAMAAHLEMTSAAFEKKHVRDIGVRRSLKELPLSNFDCVLFDNKTRQCQVYEHRPRQCRTWPFWDSNLRTPETWEETCQQCPGSGKGKLYQLESISQQASEIHV
jgi:Fe-S-cluster containining protein